MSGTPKNEKPAPDERNERRENATPMPTAQAAESPLLALCKAWLRAGATDRSLFLADVRAGNPTLWSTIERNAGGRDQ
jgi:hypothetical protein